MRGKRNMKEDATISHLLEEQFQHRKLPASVLQDQAAVAEQRATCWRDGVGALSAENHLPERQINPLPSYLRSRNKGVYCKKKRKERKERKKKKKKNYICYIYEPTFLTSL